MALAVPPQRELKAVLADMRVTGRTAALPLLLEGWQSKKLATAPDLALTCRSRIPRSWAEGDLCWEAVLARHWHAELDIGEGEVRALVTWARIASRLERISRHEI